MRLTNILIAALLLTLTACGGGGGSEEVKPVTTVSGTGSVTEITNTADLVAPEQFDYNTSRNVSLMVESPSLVGKRAFVSVFSDYEQTTELEWRPDFDSRILIERLKDGHLERNIKITNDINCVLIQLWTADPQDTPYVIELVIDNNELIWNT